MPRPAAERREDNVCDGLALAADWRSRRRVDAAEEFYTCVIDGVRILNTSALESSMPRLWALTPTKTRERPMNKMIQVAMLVVVAFSMTACGGGGTCERIDAANTKFYGSTSECKYTEGGVTVTIRKSTKTTSACNASVTKCTAADNTILESYTKCIEAAPACAAGAEKAAADAMFACAVQITSITGESKLSADCTASIR